MCKLFRNVYVCGESKARVGGFRRTSWLHLLWLFHYGSLMWRTGSVLSLSNLWNYLGLMNPDILETQGEINRIHLLKSIFLRITTSKTLYFCNRFINIDFKTCIIWFLQGMLIIDMKCVKCAYPHSWFVFY